LFQTIYEPLQGLHSSLQILLSERMTRCAARHGLAGLARIWADQLAEWCYVTAAAAAAKVT